RIAVWADEVKEASLEDLMEGKIPDAGSGTFGEGLAQYIASKKVKQAIIVTDNQAGPITTKIDAEIHMCLVGGSTTVGSFADKSVVPRCHIHELDLGI